MAEWGGMKIGCTYPWGSAAVDDGGSVLSTVHHRANGHCSVPRLALSTVACRSGVLRFASSLGTTKKRIILVRPKSSVGSVVHRRFPSTVHVTSGLSDVAYTAFGPSSLSSPHRLSGASLTVIRNRFNMTRGKTI